MTSHIESPIVVLDRAQPPARRLMLHGSRVQASHKLDAETLVLGFMADEQGVPIEHLESHRRRKLVDRVPTDDASPLGGWTLVARRGEDLVLRTDPFGTRPLFWRHDGDRTELGEAIWPLAAGARIDPIGVADMLLLGHHVGSRTLFDGVHCSLGNTVIRFGRSRQERAFDWAPSTPTGSALADAAGALGDILDRLYDPYGHMDGLIVLLSGGLDSRTLLALAVDRGIPVHAWTFVLLRGTQEEAIARAVARSLNVNHTVSLVESPQLPALAPEMVRATSGQLSLEHAHVFGPHLSAPQGYGVSVNGIYGDLFCGGSYLGARGLDAREAREEQVQRLVAWRPLNDLQKHLPGLPEWSSRLTDYVDCSFRRAGSDPRRSDLVVLASRPSRFNVWGSIAMRSSFDYITPFLDERLLRTAYGMPDRWQRESRAYHRVIAERWPTLARIPWAKTGLPVGQHGLRTMSNKVRRRLRRRPVAFTDSTIYAEAFAGLAREAVACTQPLAEAGIDLKGLCVDQPGDTAAGQALRLRAATCLLAFREAGCSLR